MKSEAKIVIFFFLDIFIDLFPVFFFLDYIHYIWAVIRLFFALMLDDNDFCFLDQRFDSGRVVFMLVSLFSRFKFGLLLGKNEWI